MTSFAPSQKHVVGLCFLVRLALVGEQARSVLDLGTLNNGAGRFSLSATYPDTCSLLKAIERFLRLGDRPSWDTVLLDASEDPRAALEAVRKLKLLCPNQRVVWLSAISEPHALLAAICAGVDGYILKSDPPGDIAELLNLVACNGAALSPRLTGMALKLIRAGGRSKIPGQSLNFGLTPRQLEVLRALSEGASYRNIGERLGVSIDTVRTHVRCIYNQLNVRSAGQAVSRAFNHGLI